MDLFRSVRAAACCAAVSAVLVVGMSGTALAFTVPDCPPTPPPPPVCGHSPGSPVATTPRLAALHPSTPSRGCVTLPARSACTDDDAPSTAGSATTARTPTPSR